MTRLRAALAPHDPADAERPWAVGDEAIVTEDHPCSAALYAGDRVRVAGIPAHRADGLRVQFVSGEAALNSTDRGWFVLRTHLRRLAPEPAALANEIGKEYENPYRPVTRKQIRRCRVRRPASAEAPSTCG